MTGLPRVWLHYVEILERKQAERKSKKRNSSDDESDNPPTPPKRYKTTEVGRETNDTRRNQMDTSTLGRFGSMDSIDESSTRGICEEQQGEIANGRRHTAIAQDVAQRNDGTSTDTIENRRVVDEQESMDEEKQQADRKANMVCVNDSISDELRRMLEKVE